MVDNAHHISREAPTSPLPLDGGNRTSIASRTRAIVWDTRIYALVTSRSAATISWQPADLTRRSAATAMKTTS